ncbi:pyrimidine 5'-nucleotidase [archaeon BMS3Abin17]|nr:pyrimidine 5'-nucleotidase [archaeon BMS3Abin17]HDZ60647.1 hypothetical protein [Candidatus Pacearchaeota archaeon]
MNEEVIIANEAGLEETKKKILEAGSENFHVLADFDNTLTKQFADGQKSHTTIAQLRNGNYLTSDYPGKAHALFDKYNSIEIDPNVSLDEKKEKMREWWTAHFKLLADSGLNKKDVEKVVAERDLNFREGSMEFLDFLHENNIPLVIMSASGLGDAISMYLKKENRLYNNVHVVSNFFEYDAEGNFIRAKEPIIHSLNKDETAIQSFPVFDFVKHRKNVLLLGDGLGDVGMVKGFDYDNLIKIGFLNKNTEENLENYKKNFDVTILNDGSMDYVNKLVKEVMK